MRISKMKKKENRNMKARIMLRTKTLDFNDLNENENLLTTPLYKFLQLVDVIKDELNITSVISQLSKENEDIILAQWMGDEITNLKTDKTIIEFHYDSLNGGWFVERITRNGVSEEATILVKPNMYDTNPNFNSPLKEIFYRCSVVSNSSL